MKTECQWCEPNKTLESVVVPICTLPAGTLYLHKDQTHPGRCILAYKDHVQKISELTIDQYREISDSVYWVIQTLHNVFNPDKVNVLTLGDISTHMHIHICPKYKSGPQWGVPFVVDEPKPEVPDYDELMKTVKKIKEKLSLWVKY